MEESSTSADPKQVVVEMPKATVVSENAKETFYRKNAGKQPAPKPPSPPKKTATQVVADTAKKVVITAPVAAGTAVVTAGTAVATKAAGVTVDTAKKVVTAPVTAAKAVAATVAK